MRSSPTIYSDSGIEWRGTDFKLLMYDKLLKMKRGNGNAVRVEAQLRGARLKELLGAGSTVTELEFSHCYRVLRKIVLKLRPRRIPKITTLAEILAIGIRSGVDLFNIWAIGKNVQHVRRMKAQVAAVQLRFHKIRWKRHFPKLKPTRGIDIIE